jgi:hypothetical protein
MSTNYKANKIAKKMFQQNKNNSKALMKIGISSNRNFIDQQTSK